MCLHVNSVLQSSCIYLWASFCFLIIHIHIDRTVLTTGTENRAELKLSQTNVVIALTTLGNSIKKQNKTFFSYIHSFTLFETLHLGKTSSEKYCAAAILPKVVNLTLFSCKEVNYCISWSKKIACFVPFKVL